MAQVKVQTSAPLSGPGLTAVAPAVAMPSPGALGLQPTINGTVPATTPTCPSPASGFVDSTVPAKNMANPKEKTPMCLVNELARFNRIQPQYNLLNEKGPAHAKIFTVQLCFGNQVWESEGSSIKKAQHSAATKALTESVLPQPLPRSPKADCNSNPGSITPTVELNGLAMKRGEPAIYRPLDPKPIPNYRANYNFRGMFNQRYHYPVPKVFYVQLTVGNNEFIGEGRTRQAARHNAAMKALQALKNEPIPERPPQCSEEKKETEENSDASKSEISLVYEIALKRNLPVNFEVNLATLIENIKVCNTNKASSTIIFIAQLFPVLVTLSSLLNIFFTGPEYGQGMNPISRLAQIQQAKKEKEPEYMLLSERGMPRRREFIMQVKVGTEVTTGTGPNKKVAKRNAAEAMLLQLGYKASTPLQNTLEKMDNKGWNGQRADFPETTTNTQKGILHLSPDVYQEMEASRNKGVPGAPGNYMTPKDIDQGSTGPFYTPSVGSTATIARELLLSGTSPTAEALILKGKAPALACGSIQPSQQLEYLAHIQGFQVQYSDRQTDKEFMTYLTLSPVQMTFHGIGSSISASHDQAALSALKQLSEQGLDPVDGPMKVENGSCDIQVKRLAERTDSKPTNSGTTAQDCKDSKAVV
uniref:Double-stranded RNA-binding protein Staufen homolog 2-like n=1 Tax=Sinocyclocheilus rhinocerous TaxID=307959 RepID=A0A673LAN9_9TELE